MKRAVRALGLAGGAALLLGLLAAGLQAFRNSADRHPGYALDLDIPAGPAGAQPAGFAAIAITPELRDGWTDEKHNARFDFHECMEVGVFDAGRLVAGGVGGIAVFATGAAGGSSRPLGFPINEPEPIRGAPMSTILIIDDSDAHRAEIRAAVDASALFDRVLEATDGLHGLKLLLAEAVDVVLCDLEMPGLDGEKLLRVKSSRPESANVPFLFLTASTNVTRKARLLEDGACDAIAKPFHPADLVARLRLHLKVKRLQDELMVKNATLARLSTIDSLTGLRTRRYVSEVLSIEFLRARRYGTPLAIFMADLDNFKAVNDEYGHPGGDAVLRAVSELMLSSLRATDVAGRYGGEELLAVLPQNTAQGAAVVAERWRADIENTAFVAPDGRLISTTISIGVADYRSSFEGPDDLVAAADKVLYVAKQKGRNRLEVHPSEPQAC